MGNPNTSIKDPLIGNGDENYHRYEAVTLGQLYRSASIEPGMEPLYQDCFSTHGEGWYISGQAAIIFGNFTV
jgi:hypothetical protein